MKKNTLYKLGLLVLIVGIVVPSGGCINSNARPLVLKKIELDKYIEIDTLERFYNDSLYLVNIVRDRAFGNFDITCGYIRKLGSEEVIYEALKFEPFRISSDFIAQTSSDNFGIVNWGWYNINDGGHTLTSLPKEKELLDSLITHYYLKCFVNSNNRGNFFLYEQGKLIKTINYGNLILQDSSIDFNRFDSKVFKLEGGKLQKMPFSAPEEIFKNGKGIYFVAKPGLGVLRKYGKKEINKTLMSYQTIADCPDEIEIK